MFFRLEKSEYRFLSNITWMTYITVPDKSPLSFSLKLCGEGLHYLSILLSQADSRTTHYSLLSVFEGISQVSKPFHVPPTNQFQKSMCHMVYYSNNPTFHHQYLSHFISWCCDKIL